MHSRSEQWTYWLDATKIVLFSSNQCWVWTLIIELFWRVHMNTQATSLTVSIVYFMLSISIWGNF